MQTTMYFELRILLSQSLRRWDYNLVLRIFSWFAPTHTIINLFRVLQIQIVRRKTMRLGCLTLRFVFFLGGGDSWANAMKFLELGKGGGRSAGSKETSGQSLELTTSRLLTWLSGLKSEALSKNTSRKEQKRGWGLEPRCPFAASQPSLLLQEPPAG